MVSARTGAPRTASGSPAARMSSGSTGRSRTSSPASSASGAPDREVCSQLRRKAGGPGLARFADDLDGPVVKVDVAPAEPVHLPGAEAGEQTDHEHRPIPQRDEIGAVGRAQQGSDLALGEPVRLPHADAADAHAMPEAPRRVNRDAPGVMRPPEHGLQRGAVVPRGGRRPPRSVPAALGDEGDEVVGGERAEGGVGVEALKPAVGVAPGLAGGVGADGARPVGVEVGDVVRPQR